MDEQSRKEIADIIWWIDQFAKLKSPKEINFIANMIDSPPLIFSKNQLKWINDIYERES
jgi:hypothetical protein